MESFQKCDGQEEEEEEEEEKLRQLEEQIKKLKEKRKKRNLAKNRNSRNSIAPLPDGSSSSSKKLDTKITGSTSQDCVVRSERDIPEPTENQVYLEDNKWSKDRFRTYKKIQGARDQGREYEQMMCGLYVLKLLARDDVENFEITTNDEKYGIFDDIAIKVAFKDKKTRIFLFQLKHKETVKRIANRDLRKERGEFYVQKYFDSISSTSAITDDVICILCSNCLTNFEKDADIAENINLKVCHYLDYEDLLLNTEKREALSVFQIIQTLGDKNHTFYFFTEQNNIGSTKVQVQALLHDLLHCKVYDSFIHFMREWWSKNFVLTKDDVIAKLTELALSPHIQTLSDSKVNHKTEYLKYAILKFPLTIVEETEEDIVENIWQNENVESEAFGKTWQKFGLESTEKSKILWFLDKVPLIVRMHDAIKTTIKFIVKLMNKTTDRKKIIFVGNVTEDELEGTDVFKNLFDLMNTCQNEEYFHNILHTFKISLQGREAITLNQLTNIVQGISEHVGVAELLKMSQTNYIIGNNHKELPQLYIPRSVSSIFVKTKKISTIYESQRNETMVIIDCDPTFKEKLSTLTNFPCVELADYFEKNYNADKNVIIFSTKSRCTHAEFTRVCDKSKKSNVYLFQRCDDEFCVLLAGKGNKLPSDLVGESKSVPESDILKYFDNPLNAVCAPPGMGKSTLMKVLYNNCPFHYWGIYVDLINCNLSSAGKPDSKALWNHFLRTEDTEENTLEKNFKQLFLKNEKIYLYLDGLDEVKSNDIDVVLDFIKEASLNGIKIWISSRENLRERVSRRLNVVPIEIQELSKQEQKEYICTKLENNYNNEKIENILNAIFASVDLNNSQQLLGIPLQLHIITEMFLNNDDAYKNIEEKNIFVLTQMYKLFFEGKVDCAFNKVVCKNQTHQLGDIKAPILKQYEIPALKACLDNDDFTKLEVKLKETESFIKNIKDIGDKYGIIKRINESGDAIFVHQTYAEYFACVWLKDNKEKTSLLRKKIFSERYENLRLMFDVMLAENCLLHLSIIYKNVDQFQEHIHEVNSKDEGGRTPLHIICAYGMKYPISCITNEWSFYKKDLFVLVRLNRELDWYVLMTKTLTEMQANTSERDFLFNFSYVEYSLEARCLYPIEILLENKLVSFNHIKTTIFKYYDVSTLAYYSAQMGYPNLFSAVITEKPDLVRERIGNESLLEVAVIGARINNVKNSSKFDFPTKNVNRNNENYRCIIRLLIQEGFDINAQSDTRMTALQLACKNSDYEITKMLLEYGATTEIVDKDGNNALHHASRSWQDNRNIIKLLIEKNITVNAQNKIGTTALQFACQERGYENSKMLLECGASISIMDKYKNNALHYASRSVEDNGNIIKLLIEKGIDVNAQNKYRTTALHLACEKSVYKNVEKLLNNGASMDVVDQYKENVLHYASKSEEDSRDIIKLVIDKGIAVNAQSADGMTALQIACQKGGYENTEKLLECGASVDIKDKCDNDALHHASKSLKNNQRIIKLLYEKGIDVNVRNRNGTTALQSASAARRYENTEMLLEYGASVNTVDKNNENALHYASGSEEDNRNIITLLISKGSVVDAQNKNGTTALQLACDKRVYENVKILLQCGASINVMDNDNNNALHYASRAWADNQDIINLLVEKGSNVNAQNKDGTTALQLACNKRVDKHIEMLLEHGSSVHLVDKRKNNALHYASRSWEDNPNTIALLIEKGVDVNTQNEDGTTALQLACEDGGFENVEKLLECGASTNVTDKNDEDALHYASRSWHNNQNMIKSLIERGINVNAQNQNGTTSLQLACEKGRYENAEALLENGAFVNIMDKHNNNPLHYASRSSEDNRNIIKLLIEKAVDIDAQNIDGTTALQFAYKGGVDRNVKFLLEYSTSTNVDTCQSQNKT